MIDPIFTREKKPKIIVFSHERAGTHFLMNSIAKNFGYIGRPWIDLDVENIPNPYCPHNIWNFLDQFSGKNVLNIFKSHYNADFVKPIMKQILSEFEIFYIQRMNSFALFDSLCRHFNAYSWEIGPKSINGMHLRSLQPSGACMRYQIAQYSTMDARRKCHISSWKEVKEAYKINWIIYENLDLNFNQTIQKIAGFLKVPPPLDEKIKRPDHFVVEELNNE